MVFAICVSSENIFVHSTFLKYYYMFLLESLTVLFSMSRFWTHLNYYNQFSQQHVLKILSLLCYLVLFVKMKSYMSDLFQNLCCVPWLYLFTFISYYNVLITASSQQDLIEGEGRQAGTQNTKFKLRHSGCWNSRASLQNFASLNFAPCASPALLQSQP